MLARCLRQNTVHQKWIYQIQQLTHYTSPHDPAISSDLLACSSCNIPLGLDYDGEVAELSVIQDQDKRPDVEEDDLLGEELDRVNDFLGNLSSVNE
jgi:hypothetical protein